MRQGDTTIAHELLPRMVQCLSLWTPSMVSLRTMHGAMQKRLTRKSDIAERVAWPCAG